MQDFMVWLASLSVERVLVCFAATLPMVMLVVGEAFAIIFFPEPEGEEDL